MSPFLRGVIAAVIAGGIAYLCGWAVNGFPAWLLASAVGLLAGLAASSAVILFASWVMTAVVLVIWLISGAEWAWTALLSACMATIVGTIVNIVSAAMSNNAESDPARRHYEGGESY